MTDIGKIERVIVIEPLDVPQEAPKREEPKEPVPEKERELEPA